MSIFEANIETEIHGACLDRFGMELVSKLGILLSSPEEKILAQH